MKFLLLCSMALGACGANPDRLNDDQPDSSQNVPIEAPAAIVQPSPPPANSVAFSYKAVGTEPGWALTINAGTMIYQGDYGSVTISEPTPPAFRPVPGIYSGTRLKLTIAPGPCSDGMSDLVYRQTVRLVADGNTVAGCGGGTVAPDALAGTSWTVTGINGRATPGGAGYFLNFAESGLTAKFGCNSIGGDYRINGDHLSAIGLVQTEMACPEPAMTFERLGSAVLNSNIRVERISGDRMRLVSEAGEIDLRRAI